jgi:hypothetical protein
VDKVPSFGRLRTRARATSTSEARGSCQGRLRRRAAGQRLAACDDATGRHRGHRGKPEQVKTLYELLRPYAALVAGSDHIHIGSVSRYLGLLAAALSRLDEAALFLQESAEADDRIGALPWSAHARADHARVLLARDAPGDR